MAKPGESASTKSRRRLFSAGWRYAALLLWLLLGLYFGIAGWTKIQVDNVIAMARQSSSGQPVEYQGIQFASLEHFLAFLASEQARQSIFGWIIDMPAPFSTAMSALAFGALGNLTTLLRRALVKKELPDTYTLLISPLLGGLTALMLLGASYILPSALTEDGTILRPTSLLFVSLFAGAFSDHLHKWFQTFMDKLFPLTQEKPEAKTPPQSIPTGGSDANPNERQ